MSIPRPSSSIASLLAKRQAGSSLVVLALLALAGACVGSALAQDKSAAPSTPACSLERHVYTCNGASFQKQLTSATNVSLETHSIDKFSQAQLKSLLTKKLGKTVVPEGSQTDLVFLLIPIDGEGIN